MFKFFKALTWHYLSLSYGFVGVLAMVFLPWGMSLLIGLTNESVRDTTIPEQMYFSYLGVVTFCFSSSALGPAYSVLRHSVLLPFSSKRLLAFLLVASTIHVMLLNLITLWCYRLLFDIDWPILTTTIWLGLTTPLLGVGTGWLRDCRWHRLLTAAVIATVWIGWLAVRCFPNGFRQPPVLWQSFTVVEALVLVVVPAAMWLVGLKALNAYRSGQPARGWLLILQDPHVPELANATGSGRTVAFRSAEHAFLTSAAQQVRFSTIGNNGILCGLTLCVTLAALIQAATPAKGIVFGMFAFACMSGLLGAILLGEESWLSKKRELPTLMATLPVSDRDLARLMRRSLQRAVVSSWTCVIGTILLAVVLHAAIFGPLDYWQHYQESWMVKTWGPWAGVGAAVASGLLTWMLGGWLGTAEAAGRKYGLLPLLVVPPAMMVLLMWLHTFAGELGRQISMALLITVAVLLAIVGTIGLTWFAAKRGLVSQKETIVCVVLTLVLCVTVWFVVPASLYWKVVWTSFAMLTFAPVPAFPIAVAWNRHR